MTYTPVIYDWPALVEPVSQTFRAGGIAVQGGMTLGGISVENPEPGGRSELTMDFPQFARADANLAASWVMSRILNGAVMRVPIYYPSAQLLSDTVTGVDTATGITWANGLGWAGDVNWRANPTRAIVGTFDKGDQSITINVSGAYAGEIKAGHIIGFHLEGYDFAHIILSVVDDGSEAVVTFAPPLRRDITGDDRVSFRPRMLVTCSNASEVAANYRLGIVVALNGARFVEAMV